MTLRLDLGGLRQWPAQAPVAGDHSLKGGPRIDLDHLEVIDCRNLKRAVVGVEVEDCESRTL